MALDEPATVIDSALVAGAEKALGPQRLAGCHLEVADQAGEAAERQAVRQLVGEDDRHRQGVVGVGAAHAPHRSYPVLLNEGLIGNDVACGRVARLAGVFQALSWPAEPSRVNTDMRSVTRSAFSASATAAARSAAGSLAAGRTRNTRARTTEANWLAKALAKSCAAFSTELAPSFMMRSRIASISSQEDD